MDSASDSPCLNADTISKKYCKNLRWSLYYGLVDVAWGVMGRRTPNIETLRTGEFWALKDVSIAARCGDIVGIIGINGSGKTTLLRLLSGICPPDTGRISMAGRAVSLLSIEAGFHPHMTVKENIYLCAAILGMRRAEIDGRLESIIEFSELGDFINSPVAALTFGMHIRLGYSLLRAVRAGFFLIDEVLAFSDAGFRDKALGDIKKISATSAVIFASHNMEMIERVCNRLVVLDKGKIAWEGDDVARGVREYLNRFPDAEEYC